MHAYDSGMGGKTVSSAGINNLNIGLSISGIKEYLSLIKTEMVEETKALIDNYFEVENSVNESWSGQAKDKFLNHFSEAREDVKTKIENVYEIIENKFQEMINSYGEADEFMQM